MKDIVMMLYPEQISVAVSQAKALCAGAVKEKEHVADSFPDPVQVSTFAEAADVLRGGGVFGLWLIAPKDAEFTGEYPPCAAFAEARAFGPWCDDPIADERTRLESEHAIRKDVGVLGVEQHIAPDGHVFTADKDGWFLSNGKMPCDSERKVRAWLRYRINQGIDAADIALRAKSWAWSVSEEADGGDGGDIVMWRFVE